MLIISGYSGCLKSSITVAITTGKIDKLKYYEGSMIIPSPNKLLTNIDRECDWKLGKMPLSNLMAQIYFVGRMKGVDNEFIVERGPWDYKYFHETYGYNKQTNHYSYVDDVFDKSIPVMLKYLKNKDDEKVDLLLLRSNSSKLIRSSLKESSRSSLYNCVGEYLDQESRYANYVKPLIAKNVDNYYELIITNDIFKQFKLGNYSPINDNINLINN